MVTKLYLNKTVDNKVSVKIYYTLSIWFLFDVLLGS